jgi:hypothetical protein
MFRGLRGPLAVALLAAALAGCASGAQPTSQSGQPATRTVSRAASLAVSHPNPPPTRPPTPTRPPVPKGTGIAGQTVLINCPVDRADPPCAGVPVPARLAVLNAAQTVITNVDTDAHGDFTVALAAGTYFLRPVRVGSQAARRPVVTMVKVTAGHYTSITLRIDNGLQ